MCFHDAGLSDYRNMPLLRYLIYARASQNDSASCFTYARLAWLAQKHARLQNDPNLSYSLAFNRYIILG